MHKHSTSSETGGEIERRAHSHGRQGEEEGGAIAKDGEAREHHLRHLGAAGDRDPGQQAPPADAGHYVRRHGFPRLAVAAGGGNGGGGERQGRPGVYDGGGLWLGLRLPLPHAARHPSFLFHSLLLL